MRSINNNTPIQIAIYSEAKFTQNTQWNTVMDMRRYANSIQVELAYRNSDMYHTVYITYIHMYCTVCVYIYIKKE